MFQLTKHRLETDAKDELACIVTLKEKWLQTWLTERKSNLEDLAGVLHFDFNDENKSREVMERFINNNPDYFESFLISWPDGIVRVSTDRRSEGRILSNRPYFKNAIDNPGVQPLCYSIFHGSPALIIAHPVIVDSGEIAYVVAGRVKLDKISEILFLETLSGKGEVSYLINSYGAFMIKGDEVVVGDVISSEAISLAIKEYSYTGRYVNSENKDVVGSCRYIRSLDAVLISEIEYNTIMRPLVSGTSMITFILIIAGFFGGLIFFLLLRNSLKPVVSLSEAVDAAAAGDFTIRVRASGSDQISTLTENFDTMISQLDQTMRELRSAEEKERRLIERANDAFLITDELGNIVRTNPRVNKLWGFSEREILNMSVFELFTEQSAKEFGRQFRLLSRTKSGKLLELTAQDSNHKPFSIEISAIALGDGSYLSIARDMSEKKKLEQELIQAQKLESVGTLAAGIAHDFDNILVGVLGAASYLKSLYNPEDPGSEMLDVIEDSAERAAGLVKQLMTFARQEPPHRELIDIGDLVDEVVRLLSKGISENIELVVRKSDGLPDIRADAIQIKQTLFNICLNGRDAMPNGGGLSIDVTALEIDDLFIQTHPNINTGKYVRITISDSGIGISENHLSRIFEPFYTTKSLGSSTGLGLAVSYGIVESHGGTITVDSQTGVGTSFHIYLPAIEIGIMGDSEEKPLVLVITEEKATQKLLQLALGSKNYDNRILPSIEAAHNEFGFNERIKLIFIGAEILGKDPTATLGDIRSLNMRVGIHVLGELPSEIDPSQIDGSIQDRYDVTLIIATVKRYVEVVKK